MQSAAVSVFQSEVAFDSRTARLVGSICRQRGLRELLWCCAAAMASIPGASSCVRRCNFGQPAPWPSRCETATGRHYEQAELTGDEGAGSPRGGQP